MQEELVKEEEKDCRGAEPRTSRVAIVGSKDPKCSFSRGMEKSI